MKSPDLPSSDLTEPLSERGQAIFDGALQLPLQQRAAYVDQACADDTALCRQVKAMLDAHENADGFLDSPAAANGAKTIALSSPVTEKPGDKIGRYKILQQLGEGGCGVVYMAEQEEPVRRRVALKIIKLGMDTKSVIARFEAERQALAMMDHPNIAKVLDAGATDTGRPYFVMESRLLLHYCAVLRTVMHISGLGGIPFCAVAHCCALLRIGKRALAVCAVV
jgi:hypothetical protein